MITLYQFTTSPSIANFSPFCMKVETYLRMSRIPFEITICNNPAKAPKGKLPYISDQGKKIGDSSFIIAYLKEKYGDVLDHHLSPKEQAFALAIQAMLEEKLYWVLVYSRWIDTANWPRIKKAYFKPVPFLLRSLIAFLAQRKVKRQLRHHGIGLHTQSEIYGLGEAIILAISNILGDRQYLMGDTPSSIDASCYAFLANILAPELNSPLKRRAELQGNLAYYCERMRQRFYSAES